MHRGVGPNPICPIFGHGHAQRTPCEEEERSQWCIYKPRHAKTAGKPSEPRGEAWNRVSLAALGRNRPCQHLDTGVLDSRTVRQWHFSCLSHLICSALLWQHSIQFSLVAQSRPTLCNPLDWSRPGYLSSTISRSLLKLISIELVMPSNHLILCCPLLLLISIFPSIGVFSNESVLHIRWPKYWSFSFSISPSNEYSGLIFFRIHWFDLLTVLGTLKGLLQHHSSKASILQRSAFL